MVCKYGPAPECSFGGIVKVLKNLRISPPVYVASDSDTINGAAIATDLDLLRELPDFGQDLAVQHTSTLRRFPDLPLELQLVIWSLTWSGRTQYISWETRSISQVINSRLRMPASGQVNRASREETMNHYKLFDCFPLTIYWPPIGPHDDPDPDEQVGYQRTTLPFFFNASLDTFSIEAIPGAVATTDAHFNRQNEFHNAVQRIQIPIRRWDDCSAFYYNRRVLEPSLNALREIRIIDKTSILNGFHLAREAVGNYSIALFFLTLSAPLLEIENIVIVAGETGKVYLRHEDVQDLKERATKFCDHEEEENGDECAYLQGEVCTPCLMTVLWFHMVDTRLIDGSRETKKIIERLAAAEEEQ